MKWSGSQPVYVGCRLQLSQHKYGVCESDFSGFTSMVSLKKAEIYNRLDYFDDYLIDYLFLIVIVNVIVLETFLGI